MTNEELIKKHTTTNEDGSTSFDQDAFLKDLEHEQQVREGNARTDERSKAKQKYSQQPQGSSEEVKMLSEQVAALQAKEEEREQRKVNKQMIKDFESKAKEANIDPNIVKTLVTTSDPNKLGDIDFESLPKQDQGLRNDPTPPADPSGEPATTTVGKFVD